MEAIYRTGVVSWLANGLAIRASRILQNPDKVGGFVSRAHFSEINGFMTVPCEDVLETSWSFRPAADITDDDDDLVVLVSIS